MAKKQTNFETAENALLKVMENTVQASAREKVFKSVKNVLTYYMYCLEPRYTKEEQDQNFLSLKKAFNDFFTTVEESTGYVFKSELLTGLIAALFKYQKLLADEKKAEDKATQKRREAMKQYILGYGHRLFDLPPEMMAIVIQICKEEHLPIPVPPSESKRLRNEKNKNR